MRPVECLVEFHLAFDCAVRSEPVANPPESDLRTRLIEEEYREYQEAVASGDRVAIAKELADFLYVVHGSGVTHGIDIDRALAPMLVNPDSFPIERYYEAVQSGDVDRVTRALVTLTLCAYAAARTHGMDLDAIVEIVHASNMSKLGADGRPILRDDGKVLKGPNFWRAEPLIAQHLVDRDRFAGDLLRAMAFAEKPDLPE